MVLLTQRQRSLEIAAHQPARNSCFNDNEYQLNPTHKTVSIQSDLLWQHETNIDARVAKIHQINTAMILEMSNSKMR